jgi:ABC-type nickel/cobalt efflux system permease component RcnA
MAEQLRKNRSLAMILAALLSLVAGLGVVLLEAKSVFSAMSTSLLTAVVFMLLLPMFAVWAVWSDRKARQQWALRQVEMAREAGRHAQQAMVESAGTADGPSNVQVNAGILIEHAHDPAASDTLAGVEAIADAETTVRPPQRAHRRRVIHEPAYEAPARAER